MAGVTLQDVIVPELFTPYVVRKTMEKSALFSSGIIVNNAEFDRLASQASPVVTMPFFEDLTGESEAVIEGAELTPDGIGSKADVAAIFDVQKRGVQPIYLLHWQEKTRWRPLPLWWRILGKGYAERACGSVKGCIWFFY